MLEAVLTHPFAGVGKPEPLRGLPHTWSRRIDQRHRLVYRVFDDRIELVAARYHSGE
jgi:toxin YoeB